MTKAMTLTPLENKDVCRFKDVMSMINPKSIQGLSTATCFKDEKVIVGKASLSKTACCEHHSKRCTVPIPDLSIAGPHCEEHSSQGLRAKSEGWSAKYLLAYLKGLVENAVPLAVVENVNADSFTGMLPLVCPKGKVSAV